MSPFPSFPRPGHCHDAQADTSSYAEEEEPSPQLISLHQALVRLLAQYEHLSKRLSSLPVHVSSSQSTVQSAVARTAATFLAVEMVKLQALPKLQKRIAEKKRKTMVIVESKLADTLRLGDGASGNGNGVEEDIAVVLQPLLEQEAQLE